MTTNLEHALVSLDRLESAARDLKAAIEQVDSAPDPDPDGRGIRLASMLEAARVMRQCGGEVCYFLAAEAMDEGVAPAVLDFPSI